MTISKQKIGVFGLGITGNSILKELQKSECKIICWDDSGDKQHECDTSLLVPLSSAKWSALDVIYVSPGVPKSHEIFTLAMNDNILILSDVQLFLKNNSSSEIIAITGTNGKSTSTALIGHILKEAGRDYHIGGNIGKPVLSLPGDAEGYVLELSSFQLDLLHNFEPDISVLLNITPDHIQHHGSFKNYCAAKEKILKHDGIKIIGIDTAESSKLYEKLKKAADKKNIAISSKDVGADISCLEQKIEDKFFNCTSYNFPKIPNLQGLHNQENIAAAFAVCRNLGVAAKEIIKHLQTFQGLKHRMQFVGSVGKLRFYNDSKATNTSAAYHSLSALKNIYWLAGGIFKEEGLELIKNTLSNIKKAYLFGESKSVFAEYLKGKIEYVLCNTMEEAITAAKADALLDHAADANILLAPACASFDQFKDFEERGDKFIELVKRA